MTALIMIALAGGMTLAGEADVIKVEAHHSSARTCTFHVKTKHVDRRWNHYANKWDMVPSDGAVVSTRTLYHAHVSK